MKIATLFFIITATNLCLAESNKEIRFTNAKYGYSFLYPDYLEVRLTGQAKEQDGRRFSVYRYEYAAPTPCLHVTVSPKGSPEKDNLLKINEVNSQFIVKNRTITVNQNKTNIYEFIFEKTNTIAMAKLYIDGVSFLYMSHNGERIEETDWYQIITTFKIHKKSQQKDTLD